jgi:hypothetical protein
MFSPKTGLTPILAILIFLATAAGLFAAYRRFHVEAANRRVEIALEWQEIATLSQASGTPVAEILTAMKQRHVTAVVIAEDTITTLEQSGAVRPVRSPESVSPTGPSNYITTALVDSRDDLDRITAALKLRGLPATKASAAAPDGTRTLFLLDNGAAQARDRATAPESRPPRIATSAEYANLRTMGLGLPPDAVRAAQTSGLEIAGRIANFPGVTEASARGSLDRLRSQGASIVIFSGDEVLGYRSSELEKAVAAMLRGEAGSSPDSSLSYGAVEFGKQKGDEKLSAALAGDFVRVHTIQAAEMGQLEEAEAVDRFVRAAKERNIRFCYVRLLTFAGPDPLGANLKFLDQIASGMEHGSVGTGGDLGFGAARRFTDTGVPTPLFALIALGAAAGVVWAVRALAPLPRRTETVLLVLLCLGCAAAALLGESGRKLVAFLAGVAYPTIACLLTYPGRSEAREVRSDRLPPSAALWKALRGIGAASLVTSIGIVEVVGLLATRPFMLRANQFLGIKAQHAIPVLVIAVVAIAGGAMERDTWERFRERAAARLRQAMDEPARFGVLLLGIVALAGLALVVARTGNDAGVGVSGVELQLRSRLDRILPVRPRTKEFLVGHPAFVLALAWWWRGRRRLAIPAFVVGSLGQVSLLNTFCHIHTPLIVSVWRDGLGLLFGSLLGAALFLCVEFAFRKGAPPPAARQGPGAIEERP